MPLQTKYEKDVVKELQDMSDEQILNLLKIIRIFKQSIIMQKNEDFYLKKEFDEWDTLSDEALQNFEKSLQSKQTIDDGLRATDLRCLTLD